MRTLVPLVTALTVLSSACSAQPAPAITGHAEIDAFVGDIVAKRRDAAVGRISSLESASGLPNAVGTPAELVDKLMTCTIVEAKPYYLEGMQDLTWRCDDDSYQLVLDPAYRAPRLTVGQFVSKTTQRARESDRRAPPPPAPPSPPSSSQ